MIRWWGGGGTFESTNKLVAKVNTVHSPASPVNDRMDDRPPLPLLPCRMPNHSISSELVPNCVVRQMKHPGGGLGASYRGLHQIYPVKRVYAQYGAIFMISNESFREYYNLHRVSKTAISLCKVPVSEHE